MIQDPYSVLGVSPSATDDEIKAAYRKLAKKYHPDVNQGSPEAEQKMKEINEAYDMVINHKYTPGQNSYGSYGQNRSGGTYQGAGGFDPFEWFTGARYSQYGNGYQGSESESADMRAVRNYLNAGHYQEALQVLSQIPVRGAKWCYYSAVAHEGLGNRINAMNYAQQAVRMDPGNMEYRLYYERLTHNQDVYRNNSRGFTVANDGMRFCLGLCLCSLLTRFFRYCCCYF